MLTIGLGILIGLVMGLTGAGGGVIAVPLLVFFLDLSVIEATPIALIAVLCAALIGTTMGLYYHTVRYKAALLMGLFGTVFSPIGILLAHHLNNRFLLLLLFAILMYVAYHSIQPKKIATHASLDRANFCTLNPQSNKFKWSKNCALFMGVSGALTGFLSGLLGVGGGFIVVPALQRINNLTTSVVVGTSLAVITVISSSVIATNIYNNIIDWSIALPFAIGGVVGILLGKRLINLVSEKALKYGFAIITVFAALISLIKALTL